MGCNNGFGGCWWINIILILLFAWGGWGGNSWSSCGNSCGNSCGCNNGCGC